MNIQKSFSMIVLLPVLATSMVFAKTMHTQENTQELALNTIRSELKLPSSQFVQVRRDEGLEDLLAISSVGWHAGPVFIYRLSQEGIEVRKNAIVHHVTTDAEANYIIAVLSVGGETFRVHGFNDSLVEYNRLIMESKIKLSSAEQAESLAEFYRYVNPENVPLTPVSTLLEMKQIAERRCQSQATSFGTGQEKYLEWWERAKLIYARLSLQQKVELHNGSYLVEWVVLSTPSTLNCGGAPLRARVEINQNGHTSKIAFLPD